MSEQSMVSLRTYNQKTIQNVSGSAKTPFDIISLFDELVAGRWEI